MAEATSTRGVVEIDDPATIERHLRANAGLHLYELGDLDPFFWPHTKWFGLRSPGAEGLRALALLYTGARVPTLLGLCPSASHGALFELLERLAPRLPAQLYTHLSPGLLPALTRRYDATHHGRHLKLILADADALTRAPTDGVEALGPAAGPELLALYARSYPDNWFDARMLETGQYVGIRDDAGALVCVAGVHVYSPRYGAAALGNVTTDPAQRGRGLARRAVARLCLNLRERCSIIGLNVHADNAAALACYRGLGFVELAAYDEHMLAARPS